jgi:exodeoxyribonuclease VII large subunit
MVESTTDLTHNLPEYTVSEISQALKRTVEQSYARVRIRGEISGFKRAGSGHRYMALKDENAVIDAICWRGTTLGVEPEDGLEVIVSGRLTTYPGRSKYQVTIEAMEVAGEGALLKLLEERRRKLADEGLFDEDRKKALPYLPDVIGVVTSPTGAVIRDILHRLRERFPRHVLLWPVAVQGEGAAQQIAAAIEGFNGLDGGPVPQPNVLIVARGGGSLEDLWSFNEEIVVRAAAASVIPVISAVGHETDVTLIDFAADRRAPTPTAAAEIAVPVRAELATGIMDDGRRLLSTISRMFDERRMQLVGLARGLPDLVDLVGTSTQRLDAAAERLGLAICGRTQALLQEVARLGAGLVDPGRQIASTRERLAESGRALEFAYRQHLRLRADRFDGIQKRLVRTPLEQAMVERRMRLEDLVPRLGESIHRVLVDVAAAAHQQMSLLESLSFERVLERGYVVVRDVAGQPINRGGDLQRDDAVTLQFADTKVGAKITATTLPKPAKGGMRKLKVTPPGADSQRRLL